MYDIKNESAKVVNFRKYAIDLSIKFIDTHAMRMSHDFHHVGLELIGIDGTLA